MQLLSTDLDKTITVLFGDPYANPAGNSMANGQSSSQSPPPASLSQPVLTSGTQMFYGGSSSSKAPKPKSAIH